MPAHRLYQLWLALLFCCLSGLAQADVFRPAYLELRETATDSYAVLWRVPARGELRLAAYVRFPAGTEQLSEPQVMQVDNSHVERWQIRHPGGLAGQRIRVEGLVGGLTDVIARIERLDGSSQVERLLPERPSFVVEPPQGLGAVAWTYLALGFEHILQGIDHLLFVLALLLIVRGRRRIVVTITAFTIAHSITLATASLGWVFAPGPPIEACIALSIVFVAAEVVHGLRGRPGLTARAPWLVAFAFGLLHGFGFASALSEVGLPQTALPLALLMFNIGVELGQLAFVTLILALAWFWRALRLDWHGGLRYLPPYAIGSLAAYWTLERVIVGFVS